MEKTLAAVTIVLGILAELLRELGLRLKVEKTRVTNAQEGFDFLSFHFMRRYQKRHGKQVTYFYPSKKAAKKYRSVNGWSNYSTIAQPARPTIAFNVTWNGSSGNSWRTRINTAKSRYVIRMVACSTE